MELENLRNSWRACNACNNHSETDWERMTARVATGKMRTSMQRLHRRWRIIGIIAATLPLQLLPQLQGGDPTVRYVGWMLAGIFVATVLLRIGRLRGLLREIDPAAHSLRDTCAAVVRLRRCFLRGVAINATLAVLLLGTLALHQWELNRPEWFYAFGVGLCIGIPLGVCIFCRMLQDIEELETALRNINEA
ncbi:MAG: hypothetical protein NC250_02915 [Alistipes senegalensis]|nr:hypothetical protein [Bacteroides cellulosilyticus]MCM1351670.1 hypothetical protein [Alistipes senegalensis]